MDCRSIINQCLVDFQPLARWWWEWTTEFTVAYDRIKDLASSYREYNESTSDA